MKVCSWCKTEKPYSEFYSNKGTKDGFGSWCKECDKREKRKSRNERRKKLVSKFGNKCQICGYDRYIGALEFHHLEPEKKDPSFSEGFDSGRSLKILIKEAKKCILVCANCHREEHAGVSKRQRKRPVNP